MSKPARKTKMDKYLRKTLREYHAVTNISQETLAERLEITPRACSALENGNSGFSTFSLVKLLSLFAKPTRGSMIDELCDIVNHPSQEAA